MKDGGFKPQEFKAISMAVCVLIVLEAYLSVIHQTYLHVVVLVAPVFLWVGAAFLYKIDRGRFPWKE